MNRKETKISNDLKHMIENSIFQAENGFSTGMILCEKCGNIEWFKLDRTDKGKDDLSFDYIQLKNTPKFKAVLMVLPCKDVDSLSGVQR